MGKLAQRNSRPRRFRQRLLCLRDERQKLYNQLAKLEAEMAAMQVAASHLKRPTQPQLDRWFSQLTQGLPDMPPLPVDFSRADLYDDHD